MDSRRVRDGVLVRAHPSVYAIGYRRVEPMARAMAAVLACGPTALLSHDSAAALSGWRRWPQWPEVTITGDRRLTGIRVHRTRARSRSDVDRQFGVPVTDTTINGFEVDAVWLRERVIVEIDSWEFHGDRGAFMSDRERDAVHADHGFVVVRITWERLDENPRRVAERLLRILAARRGVGI